MAGKCIICGNLERKTIYFDDKELEGCRCIVGKYDRETMMGFYSLNIVAKSSKAVKEVEDKCDSWDDRLKPKKT
jgi:hypothetical protein